MRYLKGKQERYVDRKHAGRVLARYLEAYRRQEDTVILGLARGGLPVAAELARQLSLPYDALLVRKLGSPGHPELAFGAIAAYGTLHAEVRLDWIIDTLPAEEQDEQALEAVWRAETEELSRRQEDYLHGRLTPVSGRTVILCDDGLATGATMRAAIELMREAGAAHIVAAVPVGPPSVCAECALLADELICPQRPAQFGAVGAFYETFEQLTDAQVHKLLGSEGRS